MSNGVDSANVLAAECDAAIEDIKKSSPTKSCGAHELLARGVIVLLRYERARQARKRLTMVAYRALVITALILAGIATGRSDLISTVLKWLGP